MAEIHTSYRVTHEMRLHGQQVINVHHFKMEATALNNNAVMLAGRYVGHVLPAMIQFQTEALTHERLRVEQMTHGGLDGHVQDLGNAQGAVAGDAAPSFVAAMINWKVNGRGRDTYGRTFIPGVPESATTGSFLAPAALTQVETIRDRLMSMQAYLGMEFRYAMLRRTKRTRTGPGPNDFTVEWFSPINHESYRFIVQGYVSPILGKAGTRKVGRGS